MKTLTMYLRAAKTEAEEAGIETDGMASSVSKLRKELLALTGNRLDIMLDEDTFKSTYQIMKELSEVWDDLSDVSQANILSLVGGKRNANAVTSILKNFQDAAAASVTAANATGSAWAENEKYLEGIEGKTKQMKAAFQDFANSIVGSGIVKSITDIVSGILNIATALNKLHLLLPTVVALGTAIRVVRANAAANNAAASIATIMAGGGDMASMTKQVNGIVGNLTTMQRRILMTKTAWVEYATTANAANLSNNALGVGVDALKMKTMGLGTALKSLKYSASFWIMIASVVISAVSAISGSINEAKEKQKQLAAEAKRAAQETQQAFDTAANSYKQNLSSYESNMSALTKMSARYKELAKHVKDNGENVDLTDDEYKEFLSLVDQIVAICPDAIQSYNDQGEAIKTGYAGALDYAIQKQQEFIDGQDKILASQFLGMQGAWTDSRQFKERKQNPSIRDLTTGDVYTGNMIDVSMATDALSLWNSLVDQAMKDLGDKSDVFRQILMETLQVDTSVFDSTLTSIQNSEEEQVRMVNLFATAFSNLDALKKALQESGQFTEEQVSKIYDLFITGDWKFSDNRTWYGAWVTKQEEQIDNALTGLEAYFRVHSSEYGEKIQGTIYNDMLEAYVRNTYDVTASASQNLKNAEGFLNDLLLVSQDLEQIRKTFNQEYSREGEDTGSLDVFNFATQMSGAEYMNAALTALMEKYQLADEAWVPIIMTFVQSIKYAGVAVEESGETTEALSTNYDKLAKSMENASNASALIEKLHNGKATLEDLIPTLLKLAEAWNSAFPNDEREWTDFAVFNEDGTVNAEETIKLLEQYIDDMIALGTDGTEFAANYGKVLENLKAALKSGGSDDDLDTIKSAFENIASLSSYLKDLEEYKSGDGGFFEMLQSAYEYAEKYKDDGIDLSDLVKWDGTSKAIEFIDITDATIDAMIDKLATSLNIGIDDLGAFRTAVKESFESSKKEADTLGDALSNVSDAFGYIEEIGKYREGDKTLFDALERAYKYAKDNEGINLSDLITWDGDNKAVQFTDLTEATIDGMIDTLATELNIGIDDLDAFRTAIRNAFNDSANEADALKSAFSSISDAFDYIKDVSSFRAGEDSLFDMLESAYEYAEKTEGVNLADLIKWDDTAKTVEFVDLTDSAINQMIDTLATELGIGAEHLEDFRAAVKASFDDAANEANALKDAFSTISDAFGYIKDVAAYKSGDKNLFDMLESAYEYAENHDSVNLADLITWDADQKSVQFADLAEQSINDMIDTLATKLNIGIDDLDSFRAAVKAAFDETKEEADALKSALDNVSSAFSYMKDVSEYRSGDKTMFDMLQSAYEYAKDHEEINIADLITWDDSAKSVKFVDLTETAINDMIDTLAAELGIGEDKLDDFRAAVRASFEDAANSADELKTALTDVNDALTYMNSIASYKSGEKNLFDMLEDAYDYAENHEGVNLADLIKWDGDTKSVQFIDLAEESIDSMIDTLAAKLNIGVDDIDAFREAIRNAFTEAKVEADTLKEALSAIGDAFAYIKNIEAYGKGEKTLFETLESAYDYASSHEGINISDLIRWDGDGKSVQFIDIAEASIDSMIDKLASELNIGIDDLDSFRAAVKDSFHEAANDADALKNALTDVSQAFSYMKDLSSYRDGKKNMFDMLQSAYDYASAHEGINLSDLIRWDDSGKSVEFVDLTEAAIDQMIDTLATSLNIGIDDLESFRAAVKAAFDDAAEEADKLKDAFSEISDAFGYIKNISSYRSGEKTLFDMLESAYEYASKHEGVNLSDLIRWDGDTKSVQFIDLAEASIDSMIDSLAANLDIGVDDLEAFRTAIKNSFQDIEDEADKLENALNKVSNVFDYIGNLSSYRKGEKTTFEMLEQAYDLAKQYEDIDLSDLVKFDASGMHFQDIRDTQLDVFIRSLADELGVTDDAFASFAEQVKNSFAESEEAAKSFSEVLSDISSAATYLNDHIGGTFAGEGFASALSDFFALKDEIGDETWSFADFFTWDEGANDFVYKTDLLQSKVDEMAASIVEDLGLTGSAAERATEAIKNSFGTAASEYEQLSDLVTKVKNVSTFNETIESFKSGDTDFIDMLSESIEMAETFGLKLEDVFNFETMQPSAIAVTNAINAAIDKMVEGKGYSETFVNQLKEAAKYEKEILSRQKKINDAYETASGRASEASNYGRDTQLTYEDYKTLIEADARYASTIEYVNGQLTVNKEKYWEVTQAINEETIAMAKLAAQQDELEIAKLTEQLQGLADQNSEEAQNIRSRIQQLQLEANGYKLLAQELENAADAFARFAAASSSTEGSMHSAAQEAYTIINDTLNNKDSDRYGMVGNEKYKAALDLVIGDVDVNTPEFDKAMATLKRYFEDDKAGVKNFYSDLVNSGIIDATTGAFDTTITEISEKLGITKDAARAMMQQLEQYADEPFDWSKLDPEGIDEATESAKTLNEQLDETKQKAEDAQAAVTSLNETEADLNDETAQADILSLQEGLNNLSGLISTLSKSSISINVSPAQGAINKLITSINNVIAKLGELNGKEVTVTVIKKEKSSKSGESDEGDGEASGSFVTESWGFADARGSIQNAGGRTLVGELGPELVVDPNTNRWYTVGETGAEFVNLPKNAIVFNHVQTAQLLGRRGGIGRSMAGGSAAADRVHGWVIIPEDLGTPSKPTTSTASEDVSEKLDEIKEKYEELNEQLEHYIKHQEQAYYVAERALDYDGMQSSLMSQAEYYRKIYEQSMQAVRELQAAGAGEGDEQLRDMEEAAWDAYQSMYEAMDQMRELLTDALNDEIDALQSAFDTLSDVVSEFNEDGTISLDTFQSLLEGGIQYLSLLQDENGQFAINTETLNAYLQARKEQLAIESALSYLSRIQEAAQLGEEQRLAALINATNELGESTWSLVYAQLEEMRVSGLISEEQYQQILENIKTLQALAAVVDTDLGAVDEEEQLADVIKEIKDRYEELNDQVEHYIKHLEHAQKVAERGADYTGQESSIVGQIQYYQQIIQQCQQAIAEMQAEGADDTSEELQSMEEAAWSAQQAIWGLYDQLYSLRTDAITKRIDDIQSAIGNLQSAMDEFGESSTISLDTFQSILSNGMQYLQYLNIENGQLSINREAVEAMIRAKKEQLAVETAMSYLSQIEEALLAGESEKVQQLVHLTEDLSDSTWAAVYAKLALLKTEGLSDEDAAAVEEYIEKLRALSEMVDTDIAAPVVETLEDKLATIKDAFDEIQEDLEHYIAHQEQTITEATRGMDFGNVQAAYEREIGYYQQIMVEAQKAMEQLRAQGADDTTAELQEVEQAYWDAFNSITEINDKMRALLVDQLTTQLDELTNAYSNLQSVVDEFNENGQITLDTFESLLQGGLQYLQLLEKEGDQYVISGEKLQEYISARKEQLAVETALSYIDQIKEALENGQTQRIQYLIDATNGITESTWAYVYAQAAALKSAGLSDDMYNQLIATLDRLRDLSGQVDTDLRPEDENDPIAERKEAFEELNKQIEHYIAHQEQAYKVGERAKNFDVMQQSLENEIAYYKQIMAEAEQAIADMKREGADDTNEDLQGVEEAYWDAYNNMYEAIDKIREIRIDELNDQLDSMAGAVSKLNEAAKQLNEDGYLSLDAFEEIIDGGIQYLHLLQDEDGQYTLSKESINDYLNAKKEQLAIETALNYISEIREALANGETERLRGLIDATNGVSSSTWDLVMANLALAQAEGLTGDQYQTALENITRLMDLANQVRYDGLDEEEEEEDLIGQIAEAYDQLNKEIEHYIAHQEQAYKESERALSYGGMQQALENEIGYYKQIMEEAQNAIREMQANGADDTNESLQNIEQSYWSAYNSMYDAIDQIRQLRVDALTKELDNLSGAFNNLKKASDDYNNTGSISLDTFQQIVSGGMEYLSLLDEENGQYLIATDRVQTYVQARKNQLAIETALSYISELREAAENGETERINKLIDATNGISSSTWSFVYAQAAALQATGLSNEQYETVIGNIDKLRALAESVNTDLSDAGDNITDQYKKQQDALDKILDFTEELIRAEAKDRVQAIQDEIKAYKEIIDLKKKALDTTKKESEYEEDVAERVKEIAQLQAKADLLSLDSSRAAAAERQSIMQDIIEKQKALSKTQQDYSLDAQKEALDREAESYEELRKAEIEEIEESVSSTEKVYQLAIARIRDHWDTLYEDLINWNTEQGNVINQEITDNWELACRAVQKYGTYLEALAGIQNDVNGLNADGKMIVADIPKYHGGGVAGDKGKLNDHEVLAILEKGELVVDKIEKSGLYTVIDFVQTLGERLGTKIGNLRNLMSTPDMMPAFAGMATPSAGMVSENNVVTFSPTFNVNIHGGDLDQRSAREYGRELAETAANSLFETFNRRGINVLQTLRQ